MSRVTWASCGAVVAVVSGGAALGGCAGAPDGSLVAVPPPDAAPAQVVQALVDAVNSRDAERVAGLTTPGFGDHLEQTWLVQGYMTDASIGATSDDAGPGTAYSDARTAMVDLTFTPEQADSSMVDGEAVSWSVLLVEQDSRWVAFDMGVG